MPDAIDEGLHFGRHCIHCFLPFDFHLFATGSAEHQVQVVHSFALWNAFAEDLQVGWCVRCVVRLVRLRYVASLGEGLSYRSHQTLQGLVNHRALIAVTRVANVRSDSVAL